MVEQDLTPSLEHDNDSYSDISSSHEHGPMVSQDGACLDDSENVYMPPSTMTVSTTKAAAEGGDQRGASYEAEPTFGEVIDLTKDDV